MRRVRGTLTDVAALAGTTGDDYLKIELEEGTRAGLADEIRELFPEAVDVVLVGGPGQVAEAPPARLGRDPIELFGEYLSARDAEDPAVLALFAELLEESYEA